MLRLIFRLIKHPGREHLFTQSRSRPGMMTCKICKVRVWSTRGD